MIFPPSFPPHIDEPAEEQVFNILKRLDGERYDVFYRRRFVGLGPREKNEYEVDFLIADLGGGRFNALLDLEVKGGMVKYDGVNSVWTQNGHPMRGSDDPVEQAQGNVSSLVKRHPAISARVPFGWAVCFPDPRNTYSKKQIPAFLHPLQLIEPMALATMEKHLPMLLSHIRESQDWRNGADMDTYRKLKESLLAGLGQVVPLHTRLEAEDRRLISLTEDQMRLLDMIRSNKRLLVSGPAGCGKTIMATTIARQAREEGLRVLMLTFNRIPAANIRVGLGLGAEDTGFIVDNYHHWAHMQVEEEQPGVWDAKARTGGDDFWNLESAMMLYEVLVQRQPGFDVLIIDEGQDFRRDWLEALMLLLKPQGRFYIFMDEDQNIFDAYSGLPQDWHFSVFRLPHNCRNTRHIIERLECYLGKKIPCLKETPQGEPVRIYPYKNDIDQARILKDEWLRLVKDEGISPGQIVIILNTHFEESCLKNTKAFGPYPIQPVSKDTGLISPAHVNVTTITTFKGLEADMVFIADTDKMQKPDKRILYTQASRARLWLGVMEKRAY